MEQVAVKLGCGQVGWCFPYREGAIFNYSCEGVRWWAFGMNYVPFIFPTLYKFNVLYTSEIRPNHFFVFLHSDEVGLGLVKE